MGYDTSFFMFNIMGNVIPVIVICMFAFVFISIVVTAIRSAKQNSINNASPVLNVTATVIAKRTEIRSFRGNNMHHSRTRTNYFATFQVESGDRMEFSITGEQWGLLLESDIGVLTFQGTRFLEFNRS